jgi:hypothetical protein
MILSIGKCPVLVALLRKRLLLQDIIGLLDTYFIDSINRILGALLGKPLLLLNDVICMFDILITDSADSKKALKKTS